MMALSKFNKTNSDSESYFSIRDFFDNENNCLLCEFETEFKYTTNDHISFFHDKKIFYNLCNYCFTIIKGNKKRHLSGSHMNSKLKKCYESLIKYFGEYFRLFYFNNFNLLVETSQIL